MKIDLERAVKAPFMLTGDNQPLPVYLIMGGIAFGVFIIAQLSGMIMQLIGGIAGAMSSSEMAIVGILLTIVLSLIMVVVLFAAYAIPMGYITETIKLEVYNRESIMPGWSGNFGRFFINGLKFMLLMLLYWLIFGIIIAIPFIFGGIVVAATKGSEVGGIIMLLATIFAMGLILLFTAIIPFIWVRYAAEGSIISALNIFEVIKKIFANILDYILAIIIYIVLAIGMLIVCLVLCVTCVGILVIPLVQMFIFPIIVMNIFAQVYKD